MSKVLVVAELSASGVRKTTHSAVTAARQIASASGGEFSILVLGSNTDTASQQLRALGAASILVCQADSLENYLSEHYTPTVAAVAANFDFVVATASSYGKDLMPRTAARLGAAYLSDCSELKLEGNTIEAWRPLFAGNAFGLGKAATDKLVLTVRQSEFEAAVDTGGESPITSVPLTAPGTAAERIEFVSLEQVTSDRPELAEARVVVSGGRALKEKFFEVIGPLADTLGAAIGASRAACDAGYAPGDFQVGQTGKVVAPELYFAIGISGAIQHIAGMKSSRTIVAINKDSEAPIFQISDYGLVADLFDAVPELVTALQARK